MTNNTRRMNTGRLVVIVSALIMPLSAVSTEAPTLNSINSQKLTQKQQLQSQDSEEPTIYFDYFEEGILQGGVVKADAANVLQSLSRNAQIDLPPYSVTTILDNGPTDNRIDIVIVGDGYTVSELGTYASNVSTVIDNFFNQPPLQEYQPFFNVHRVDVISNESGVDNDPTQGINKDTALDMGYWCGGTERLLCVNVSKAQSAANNAADVDQILAVANSSKYGGAGYSGSDLGTVAGNNSLALEVAIHEFGHSFADLADEYSYGGSETYTGGELGRPNVSIYQKDQMLASSLKWYRWMDLPEVDTFEGGNYHVYGVYRPTINSKMRSLNQPFGPVNIEQFLIKIYQSVSPIDSATANGTYDHGTLLTANPIQPTDHNLDVQWWVDGELVDNGGATEFDTSSLSSDTDHTVAARITDNTDWVRDETARNLWMTEERVWTILASSVEQQADLSVTITPNNAFGWASPFQWWKYNDSGLVGYKVNVKNSGPQSSENVALQNELPGFTAGSSYSYPLGTHCDNATHICQLGNLAANESLQIVITATVTDPAKAAYIATVSSDTDDPNESNNATTKTLGGSMGWLSITSLVLLWGRKRFNT